MIIYLSSIRYRFKYQPDVRYNQWEYYFLLFCSDIEEEIDSLKHFTTELVIEAAVRCLDVIQPGLGLPHSLPDSMSARFRVGASIAQACKVITY